jgi:hypothetical protein
MVSVVRFDRQQNTLGTLYYHIVQVVYVSWTASTSFTTIQAYQQLNGGTLSITPLYTGSKFHVMANIQGYCTTGGGVNIGLSRTLTGTTTRLVGVDGSSGDSWAGSADGSAPANQNSWTINRQWLDSPGVPAGTPVTYNALGGNWSGGTFYCNYTGAYGATSNLTIWEIQP